MCARLVDMGATLVDIDIPELHRLQLAHVVTIASEIAASQLAQMPAHRRDYSLSVRMILALVEGLTGSDYVQAQRIRGLFAERFERLFAQVDVIVTPTSACTAPRYRADSLALGESDILLIDKVMRFVRPGNFLGHPAISFPAGDDDNGLPIGFQVMGKPWDEALLLRMARLAEKDTVRRAPQFHRALMRA
jgi:Asp-tRNA(Asn)/Glu-tRNA(Gln) amidotransferase A subunit family amidase